MITSIRKLIVRLRHDERGLTAVEYAVLGGIIVTGLASVATVFQTELTAAFSNILP